MSISNLLIALLRAELCDDYSAIPTITEDSKASVSENVFALADRHDLAHFIYGPMKACGLIAAGSELEAKLKKQQMLAVFRYKRIEHELSSLSALFEEAKIPFIPLKGSVIRKYYKNPWMRTSCDIDILVKESDLDASVDLITNKLGYKTEGDKNYHDISLYSPGGVHLELHFNINEGMKNLDRVLERVWDYASPKENGACEHVLSPEFFMFHIIAHMSYHFINGGCGIRPFMDMYLVKKSLAYNEAELKILCDEAALTDFYPSVSRLCDVWFGDAKSDDLSEKMQSYLILGGVYGTFENKLAVANKKRGGTFGYVLSRLFMPKHLLQSKYPILKRHPWLLPFCQVRRWFSVLFGGKIKKSVSEVKMSSNLSNERIDETAELMKSLGLY